MQQNMHKLEGFAMFVNIPSCDAPLMMNIVLGWPIRKSLAILFFFRKVQHTDFPKHGRWRRTAFRRLSLIYKYARHSFSHVRMTERWLWSKSMESLRTIRECTFHPGRSDIPSTASRGRLVHWLPWWWSRFSRRHSHWSPIFPLYPKRHSNSTCSISGCIIVWNSYSHQ